VKVLLKIGGTLLDENEPRERLARQIADAARQVSLVVVHGGGRQMTRYLSAHGIASQFVNGLRVTTPEVLDAVVKVIAGSVNRQLTVTLNRAGGRAVGISGIDAGLVEAEEMDPALGSVGRVTQANPALLDALLAGGFLPVVACVAGGRDGRIYNVNADQMAVACAAALGADKLIFLTDVEGVLDTGRRLLSHVTLERSQSLIAEGIATGGMLAKLNAAATALRQGVPEVRIAAGNAEGVVGRILSGENIGTRLSDQEVCAQ